MVSPRRLIIALLLCVPFLSGVNVRPAAFVDAGAGVERDALSIGTAHLMGPALPGAAAIGSLLELGSAAPWRTPTRTTGGIADPLGNVEVRAARTRAACLDHSRLHYCHTLDKARTNVPITYGNPPPVSLT